MSKYCLIFNSLFTLYNIPNLKLLVFKLIGISNNKLLFISLAINSLTKKPLAYPFNINGYLVKSFII